MIPAYISIYVRPISAVDLARWWADPQRNTDDCGITEWGIFTDNERQWPEVYPSSATAIEAAANLHDVEEWRTFLYDN